MEDASGKGQGEKIPAESLKRPGRKAAAAPSTGCVSRYTARLAQAASRPTGERRKETRTMQELLEKLASLREYL